MFPGEEYMHTAWKNDLLDADVCESARTGACVYKESANGILMQKYFVSVYIVGNTDILVKSFNEVTSCLQ